MSNNENNSAEVMREKAMEYLNGKYNDTFTAEGYSSSNWSYEYSSVTFKSKNYPSSVVEVRAYKNDDNSYTFKDNYYKSFMHDGAVIFFEGLLKEAEVKVQFPNTIWSDEIDGASSFSEWQSVGNCKVDCYFITTTELSNNEMDSIVENIATQKVSGTITFITTEDTNKLASETIDEILNNQEKYILSKCDYFINSDFNIEK